MRRSLAALFVAAPLFAACGIDPNQPEVASSSEALRGPVTTPSCNAGEAALLRTAINVGNFVAQTQDFQDCVATYYRACNDDSTPTLKALLSSTRSVNATRVGCADLADIYNGITHSDDEHGAAYTGTEIVTVNTSPYLDNLVARFSTDVANGNFGAPFSLAGVIWHEVMHVHGFQHGDNTNAKAAASACGYGSDPTWFWQRNSGPYDVQRCLSGTYGSLSTAVKDAHKRDNGRRAAIFQSIMAGGYTLAQFERDVWLNGIPSGATPVAVNSTAQDELFDGLDKDYFAIDLAQGGRIVVILLFPTDGPAPSLTVDDGILGEERARTSGDGVLTRTLDLPAGRHVLHASGNAAFQTAPMPITLWVAAVAPPAPLGCRGTMVCDGTVAVSCDMSSDPLVLERLDGATWTTVDRAAPLLGLNPSLEDDATNPSTTPVTRRYRVCTDSNAATPACAAEMAIAVVRSQCPVGPVPPHHLDCSDRANWTCNTLPDGTRDCHCGPYVPKIN